MATTNKGYVPQIVFHPGETLGEKLDEMGMGPKEFALRTGKPEKTIIAVLKGESSITPDMAVQFENVTRIPAHFWMNHQRGYDEYIAREKRKSVIERAGEWAKQFPVTQMKKLGWIPEEASTGEEKTSALLSFFALVDHTAWEKYYFQQELKTQFRISLAHARNPHALSAWLRAGEITAQQLPHIPYDETKFKAILAEIKTLMAQHPDNYFVRLQELCLSVGVKVVYTPCINKVPVGGATRWMNDAPLIQLSGRHKRNDIFWFNFFHEAGHILLHGKKDIFIEEVDEIERDESKEKEADDFAVKRTFDKKHEAELLNDQPLTIEKVVAFAERTNTHPAIIIGRLQHEHLLQYWQGKELIIPIDLEKEAMEPVF